MRKAKAREKIVSKTIEFMIKPFDFFYVEKTVISFHSILLNQPFFIPSPNGVHRDSYFGSCFSDGN